MTDIRRRAAAAGLGLLLLVVSACEREPGGWTPVLEESSVGSLRSEVEVVATHVQEASRTLASEPERSAEELQAAQASLHNLLAYYLPILEARELAYNAYRHYQLGEKQRTETELEKIEAILFQVAQSGNGQPLHEMESPLEELEDARVSLQTDAREASRALEALAIRLNFLLIKADLILTE